jgi:hypothetical protein
MPFNRWSPYSYGTNNTKGWRLSAYDPDEGRIFDEIRTPANKREWIKSIEYSSKAWLEDKDNLIEWVDYVPTDIFLYQAIIYVSGYYVAFKNYKPNVVFAYRGLIETLLSEMSPENIFEVDLHEWSIRKDTPIVVSYVNAHAPDNLSKSNNAFQCSRCFLVFHKNTLTTSGSQGLICGDCG